MKIAIVHYWWLANRGGESVISALIDLFPTADLYFHVYEKKTVREALGSRHKGKIYTTFISQIPFSKKLYQRYLPLMPIALESLDLTSYDIVLSSESGPAKGVITRPDALHLCYCHSPMRYLWDLHHEYNRNAGLFKKVAFKYICHKMRIWDQLSANRVDVFVANSNFVAQRIQKYYRRSSLVVNPPVNVGHFSPNETRLDYYLCLGQLVGYKRVDLAVDAFNKLGKLLVVIGEGEEFKGLLARKKANVSLIGRQQFAVVKHRLETCRALIFPGVEDFGIVPVEAMASGAPVIAFGQGGILDSVVDGVNGVLFNEQTVDSLVEAVGSFELRRANFDPLVNRQRAMEFDKSVFLVRIEKIISESFRGNKVPTVKNK